MVTQVSWLTPCRSPTMVGSAVATMVWSSAARNTASISATKMTATLLVAGRPPAAPLGRSCAGVACCRNADSLN